MIFKEVGAQIVNLGGNGVIDVPYISTIFKALGGVVALYIIYLIVNTILNLKKNKELKRMRELLERMSIKLDRKK